MGTEDLGRALLVASRVSLPATSAQENLADSRYPSQRYYAEYFGYECELLEVETEDGFVLRVHHLLSKKHKQLGHPVILQHGILSNSTTFMVNEERSLAFWLMEQGEEGEV